MGKKVERQQESMKGVFLFTGGGVPGVRMIVLFGNLRTTDAPFHVALVAFIPGISYSLCL
jgi:hypothetical protein